MKNKNKEKIASVFGSFGNKNGDDFKAVKLLRKAGYRVHTLPVTEIFEVICHQPDRESIRLTDLKTLKKFLRGEKIPRSMWTIT